MFHYAPGHNYTGSQESKTSPDGRTEPRVRIRFNHTIEHGNRPLTPDDKRNTTYIRLPLAPAALLGSCPCQVHDFISSLGVSYLACCASILNFVASHFTTAYGVYRLLILILAATVTSRLGKYGHAGAPAPMDYRRLPSSPQKDNFGTWRCAPHTRYSTADILDDSSLPCLPVFLVRHKLANQWDPPDRSPLSTCIHPPLGSTASFRAAPFV